MNRQEILDVVKSLAMSQGYYGRLYDALTNGTDEAEYALQEMEEQNFKDAVDMVELPNPLYKSFTDNDIQSLLYPIKNEDCSLAEASHLMR